MAVAVVYAMIGFCVAAIHLRWHRAREMHPRALWTMLAVAFLLWPLPLVSAVLIEVSR